MAHGKDKYTPGDWIRDHVASGVRSPHEVGRSYDQQLLDITGAKDVQIEVSHNMSGYVLHVNIDGMCALRVCRIKGGVDFNNGYMRFMKEIEDD